MRDWLSPDSRDGGHPATPAIRDTKLGAAVAGRTARLSLADPRRIEDRAEHAAIIACRQACAPFEEFSEECGIFVSN
jgi:hypothetical protein